MTTDTITAPAPIETVTPIKPSEAIRLGCLTTRQTFKAYGSGEEACAMGAMVVGLGCVPNQDDYVPRSRAALLAEHAINTVSNKGCPVRSCSPAADNIVVHLNDDHRWSREQIADWLEGVGL